LGSSIHHREAGVDFPKEDDEKITQRMPRSPDAGRGGSFKWRQPPVNLVKIKRPIYRVLEAFRDGRDWIIL